MYISSVVAILEDVQHKRFHPIIFAESPLPGGGVDGLVRYKSTGHHTEGFDSREAAEADAEATVPRLMEHTVGTVDAMLTGSFLWDGNGIPATIALRSRENWDALFTLGGERVSA